MATFVGVVATVLSLAAPSWAGCVNTCEITVTEPVLEPALDCLKITPFAGTCDCGSGFDVASTCASDVEAVGFTFIGCIPTTGSTNSTKSETNIIRPNYSCLRQEKLSGVGTTDYEYHFVQNEIDYTLTFQANVTSFDDSGCSCSHVGRSAKTGGGSTGLVVLFIGVLCVVSYRYRRRIVRTTYCQSGTQTPRFISQ
jgi:hypothetical protein